jgi:hypothetical protein
LGFRQFFARRQKGAMAEAFTPALTAEEAVAWIEQSLGLVEAARAVGAAGLDGADLAHCEVEDLIALGISRNESDQIIVRPRPPSPVHA